MQSHTCEGCPTRASGNVISISTCVPTASGKLPKKKAPVAEMFSVSAARCASEEFSGRINSRIRRRKRRASRSGIFLAVLPPRALGGKQGDPLAYDWGARECQSGLAVDFVAPVENQKIPCAALCAPTANVDCRAGTFLPIATRRSVPAKMLAWAAFPVTKQTGTQKLAKGDRRKGENEGAARNRCSKKLRRDARRESQGEPAPQGSGAAWRALRAS